MQPDLSFGRFTIRVTLVHMATYMVAGLLFSIVFDYRAEFESESLRFFMRSIDSKWIAAGPGLQAIRGLVFAAVLWPFRKIFLDDDAAQGRAWLKLWLLLVGIGILSTYGPSPGSIEGVIYTKIPIRQHVFGAPEVWLQSAAFSFLLIKWCNRPHRAWGIVFGIAGALVVMMSLAAVFLQPAAGG